MTFTSSIFIVGLLPWFVIIYNMIGKNKNTRTFFLFLANSMFYIWGGIGTFIFIGVYSLLIYIFSCLLTHYKNKGLFSLSIIFSIAPLIAFKYTGFIINNFNYIFNYNITYRSLIVPMGISFITFEAVSFLVDVYNEKIMERHSLINVYMYLTFFATVTSGPIIRYNDFKLGLANDLKIVNYADSIEKIVIGLCKKVLVADKIAILADYYFDGIAVGNNFSSIGLWIGSIAYTLQLYFDFSGYSDIAIGIGQLLGFDIPNNFNKPYHASSISDFWKRWHISLTTWFREYIYIPLGGNRCSILRHLFNMFVVWLLTGIWHGADWSFIFWGFGYLVLLIIEKYVPFMRNISNTLFGHIYALFFINLLWIPFRADSMMTTVQYYRGMFLNHSICIEEKAVSYLPLFILTVIACLPWEKILNKVFDKKWFTICRGAGLVLLAGLSICALINSSYTPYIYGNF